MPLLTPAHGLRNLTNLHHLRNDAVTIVVINIKGLDLATFLLSCKVAVLGFKQNTTSKDNNFCIQLFFWVKG